MLTRNKKRKLPEVAGGYLLTPQELNFSKRRRVNSKLHQVAYLSQFISNTRKQKSKLGSTFKEFKRSKGSKHLLRKEHSVDVQALVIFLRHGTLKSDKMIVRKLTQIEKMTGVKICSQLRIYERWRRRGFLIINEKR
jgi:hypothetical protein